MTYNGHNLHKALEKAQGAVEEAAQHLNRLQYLQVTLDAAVVDPDLVICEPSYGLPSVARIERVTKRDIVLEGGRRARRKTLRLEGGDKWSSTRIKHLDAKWALDDA